MILILMCLLKVFSRKTIVKPLYKIWYFVALDPANASPNEIFWTGGFIKNIFYCISVYIPTALF